MRKTQGWIGARLAVATVAVAIGVAPRAWASPTNVTDYLTTSKPTVFMNSGLNVISFNAVAGGQYESPSSVSLGEFVVNPLPTGASVKFENTPFEIMFQTTKVNGDIPEVNETPLKFVGKLNGELTGNTKSSVVATFDPVQPDPTFRTGDFMNTLTVPSSFLLVPSSTNGGRTTVQSTITSTYYPLPTPAPEPTTIAVFVMAGVGLGLRRRLRAKVA